MASYRVIEHTADAGIAATGATKAECFEQAAAGLYSLMVNPRRVREREARTLTVEGENDVQLLERWLQELLYVTETEGLVFGRFEVTMSDGGLEAACHGERMDSERHEFRGDVKGVTKHMTTVEQRSNGYRARVLLDM
jgi:SHS2 domain-containing protein